MTPPVVSRHGWPIRQERRTTSPACSESAQDVPSRPQRSRLRSETRLAAVQISEGPEIVKRCGTVNKIAETQSGVRHVVGIAWAERLGSP